MANSASTQLFDLISSMSRSEKRYFKIHIRTHASKHSFDYIRLFKLVESQDSYDEAEVIKAMEEAGNTQRFAVLKHRLFEKVLDSLASFQLAKDPWMELRQGISKAKVLAERGMTGQAETMLLKICKKAQDIEAYPLIADATRLLGYLEVVPSDSVSFDQGLEALSSARSELEVLRLRTQMRNQLDQEGRSKLSESEDAVSAAKKLNKAKKDNPHSTRLGALVYQALSVYSFSKNEIRQSLELLNEHEQAITGNDFLHAENPIELYRIWTNQCYLHIRLHEMDIARNLLMRLSGIDSEWMRPHQLREFRGLLLQSLLFYLNRISDPILEDRTKELLATYLDERWEHPSTVRGALDYSMGVFFHARGDRNRSLKALNRILNDGDISRDEDIYHRTLVMVTVLHYETKDREWMVHSARALKRYLRPRGLMNGVEQRLLDLISQTRRARSEEGEQRALLAFIHQLRSIRRIPQERISFEHFDFLQWAERLADESGETGLVA